MKSARTSDTGSETQTQIYWLGIQTPKSPQSLSLLGKQLIYKNYSTTVLNFQT